MNALCVPCSDRGVIRVGTWEDGEHWYCDACAEALGVDDPVWYPLDAIDFILGGIVLGLVFCVVVLMVALKSGLL